MAEGIGNIAIELIGLYNDFISALPPSIAEFFNLIVLVLLVVLYSVFIWKFYRFVATKNILGLNLNKYNKSKHPLLTKILAGTLYLVEYIIILPFLIFFWFSIFTIFLIFLTENLDVHSLLIISATIIAAIRMTSYYNEDLSKDVAKLLPFTLLAISILNPNFFSIERIFNHISELPKFFNQIMIYLAFIIILEIILRLFDFIFSLFNIEEIPKAKEKEETEEESSSTEEEEVKEEVK